LIYTITVFEADGTLAHSTDLLCESDEEALALVKRLISYNQSAEVMCEGRRVAWIDGAAQPPLPPGTETPLEEARRLVLEGRQRIARQRAQLDRLAANGPQHVKAQLHAALATLLQAQELAEARLASLERRS
jgi:hypothetical protein